MPPNKTKKWPPLWMSIPQFMLLTTVAILGFSLCAGASWGWQGWDNPLTLDIRAPRTLAALLAGGLLGLSGAVAQDTFQNPLAEPFLLGSGSGAALAVCGVLMVGFSGNDTVGLGQNLWWLTAAAFAGALGAVGLTLMLAKGATQTHRLLLSGVVVGVVLGALLSLFTAASPRLLNAMQGFLLGSVSLVSWQSSLLMGLALLICLAASVFLAKALDAMALGQATAYSLGWSSPHLQWSLVGILALGSGSAVAHTGLIGFVGLAAPHAVRGLFEHRPTQQRLFLSTWMGGLLLLAADVLARVIVSPQEIPVGVVTSLLGGVYLLWRLK